MGCAGWLESCVCLPRSGQMMNFSFAHQPHPGHLAKALLPSRNKRPCAVSYANVQGRWVACLLPNSATPPSSRNLPLRKAGCHSLVRRFISEACLVWYPRGTTTTAGSYNFWLHSSPTAIALVDGGPQMRQDPHHSEVDEELIPTAIVIKICLRISSSPRAQTPLLCMRSWSRWLTA